MLTTLLTWFATRTSRLNPQALRFTLVVAGALVAGALLWHYLHPPAPAGELNGQQRRAARQQVAQAQAQLAADTAAAGRLHRQAHPLLDSARAHARRATTLHRRTASPRHAPPHPAASPAHAAELQRQLSTLYR